MSKAIFYEYRTGNYIYSKIGSQTLLFFFVCIYQNQEWWKRFISYRSKEQNLSWKDNRQQKTYNVIFVGLYKK